MVSTRLGPHVINPTADALAWARVASIVKAIDTTEPLRVAPDNAVRVFRHYFGNQDIRRSGADIASEVLTALGGYRHPRLYTELYNECGAGVYKQQTHQINEAAPILHAAGIKLCGPCWSTGDYGETEWRYLVDNTRGALDAINVHAYMSPQYGPTEWNAYRYRKFWRMGDPPVILSEVGEDVVRDAPGSGMVGAGGWRKNGTSPHGYTGELLAYDVELAKDAYMLGATVFTAGAQGGDWKDYDTDGLNLERVFTGGTPALTPTPAPAPPKGATPMINYQSPNHEGPRASTLGIVVHSTRGGSASLEQELDGTMGWENRPNGDSCHAVVSPTRTGLPVQDNLIAWHCRTRNKTHLGIEFCQPRIGDPIPDSELQRGAQVCAGWCVKYHIPTIWALNGGFAQHKDCPEGQADGKSDVGTGFDGDRFMVMVKTRIAEMTAPAPVKVDAVTDALNGAWQFATLAEGAPNLDVARTNATLAKTKIAQLKVAIGR